MQTRIKRLSTVETELKFTLLYIRCALEVHEFTIILMQIWCTIRAQQVHL